MKSIIALLFTTAFMFAQSFGQTISQDVQAATDKLKANADALEAIVNGPASGDGSSVTLPLGGTQDTVAKAIKGIGDSGENVSFTIVQSKSGTNKTLARTNAGITHYVLAKDYGVSPSETANNNTIYLQAAEDAANAANATLILPSGTINIDSAININAGHDRQWIGQGAETTTIHQTNPSADGISFFGSFNGLILERFQITGVGVGTSTGYGINLTGGTATIDHGVFRNLRVIGFNRGLYASYLSNSKIEGCSFLDCADGFYAENSNNSNNIDNCAFVNNTTQGLFIQGNGWRVNSCDFGGPNQPLQIAVVGFATITGGNMEIYQGTHAIQSSAAGGRTTLIGLNQFYFGGLNNCFGIRAENNNTVTIVGCNLLSDSGAIVQRVDIPRIYSTDGGFSATASGGVGIAAIGLSFGNYRTGTIGLRDGSLPPAFTLWTGDRLSGKDDTLFGITTASNQYAIGTVAQQPVIVCKSGSAPLAILTGKAGVSQSISHRFYGANQLATGQNAATQLGTVTIITGSGAPEGVFNATVGSTYHRTDGGPGTSFYVKESGVGNTGWVAK